MVKILNYVGKSLNYFGGIVTAIIFIIAGVNDVISFLNNHHLPVYITVLIIVFALILLFITFYKLLYENYLKLKTEMRNTIIKDELSSYTKLNSKISFYKILPKNSFLDLINNDMYDKAIEWDQSATLLEYVLMMSVGEEDVELNIHSEYHSKVKKETILIWGGSLTGLRISEDHIDRITVPIATFYQTFPDWQKYVKACYEVIKDKLPNQYSIQIRSQRFFNNKKEFLVYFSYSGPKMEHSDTFYCYENSIKYNKTNQIIAVK